MQVPTALRALLADGPWLPGLPVAVYGFDGLSRIDEALRAVDPALGDRPQLPAPASVEGMLVRLTGPVSTGRPTRLTPAATAPFLGQPGIAEVSIQVSLYAPRTLTHSVDTAIDRVEIATDGSSSQTDQTTSPSLVLGHSGPLDSADRLGPTVPLLGDRAGAGQTHTSMAPRREMLRFGTPKAGEARGARSDLVEAIAVARITGPGGATRWATGTIVLRALEAPPTARGTEPPLPGSPEAGEPRTPRTLRHPAPPGRPTGSALSPVPTGVSESSPRSVPGTSSPRRAASWPADTSCRP
jgi:hypothetical protein